MNVMSKYHAYRLSQILTSIRIGSSTLTNPASSAPLNEWHTVNVVGVMEAQPVSATSAVGGTEEGADGDDKANVIGGASPGWYGGMLVRYGVVCGVAWEYPYATLLAEIPKIPLFEGNILRLYTSFLPAGQKLHMKIPFALPRVQASQICPVLRIE